MTGTSLSKCLPIFFVCGYLSVASSEPSEGKGETRKIGCQERSTLGRSYAGGANTTVSGIPCQKWSDTQPHSHSFTHVGDHNFCRNPDGASQSQVWCFTTDPGRKRQNCPVPFCHPQKALDFSLDNDCDPDENNSYTHVSLQKENLPSSFTICTAFMIEAWTEYTDAVLFGLRDEQGQNWLRVEIFAADSYTEFSFHFEDSPTFAAPAEFLFYPLQWTRVCLSQDSNTSEVRLVVDGEQLVGQVWKVNNKPDHLNLTLGILGENTEQPGRTAHLNIFSSALPVQQMQLQTSAGEEECGLEGDFLSWERSLEEEEWTLHSKARLVDLDGKLESPCMTKSNLNVFPLIEGHYHNYCMDHCKKLGGRSPPVTTEME